MSQDIIILDSYLYIQCDAENCTKAAKFELRTNTFSYFLCKDHLYDTLKNYSDPCEDLFESLE